MSDLRTLLATTAMIGAMIASPAVAVAQVVDEPVVLVVGDKLPPVDASEAEAGTVTAFPHDVLEARNITTALPLLRYVPNAVSSHNPGLGSANIYYIRGIGSTETLSTFDSPVGTFVDGIYLGRQGANNIGFFDIERADVRRGPQGVLFGRNTSGGAIDIALARPGDKLAGFLEGGYGSFGRKETRGSVDVPFNAGISVKVSGYYSDDKGYVRDTTTGARLNDGDRAGLRGAVQFKPTDQLTWNLSAAYMRDDSDNLLNFDCDPANASRCKGRFATTGLPENGLGVGTLFAGTTTPVSGRKGNFGLGNRAETQLYTSQIDYDFGGALLSLITGGAKQKQRYAIDLADGRALPTVANPVLAVQGYARGGYTILNDSDHSQFSQEVKLDGKLFGDAFDYVVGGFYYHEDDTTDFADVLTTGTGAAGTSNVLADRIIRTKTNAKAGYAQLGANLGERIRLTGGVRYTDETRNFSISDNRANCGAAPCLTDGNLGLIPNRQRDKIWTPSASATFKATDDVSLFVSASRGYTSGGWNGRATTAAGLTPFGAEKVWTYEGGAKTHFLDDRLRVNLTGFYLDTNNLQVASASLDQLNGGIGYATRDVGFRNKGAELEVVAMPVKGLTLHAEAGYQDARYKIAGGLLPDAYGLKSVRQQQLDCTAELAARRVPLAPAGINNAPDCAVGIVDANGNIARPVRTPKITVAAGASYDYAIPAAGIVLQPSATAMYRSKSEVGTANNSLFTGSATSGLGAVYAANPFGGDFISGSQVRSFVQVDGGLSMRTDDGHWTIAVECQNCFDKAYVQSTLGNYSYLSPPRTWLARAKRVF
jgi:iron complex outermembrane receptor protein